LDKTVFTVQTYWGFSTIAVSLLKIEWFDLTGYNIFKRERKTEKKKKKVR